MAYSPARDLIRSGFCSQSGYDRSRFEYTEQRDILRLVWGIPLYLWVVSAATVLGAAIWGLSKCL